MSKREKLTVRFLATGVVILGVLGPPTSHKATAAIFTSGTHTINGNETTLDISGSETIVNVESPALIPGEPIPGAVATLSARVTDAATLNVSGGTFQGHVNLNGSATLNTQGGTFGLVQFDEQSRATIESGQFEFLNVADESTITIHGGTFERVDVVLPATVDSPIINIHGGTFTAPPNSGNTTLVINASTTFFGGTVNIFGTDFNRPTGPVFYDSTNTFGTITGTFIDGSPIDIGYVHGFSLEMLLNGGSTDPVIYLIEIPEPTSLSCLVAGMACLLPRRGRKTSFVISKT